MRLWRDARATSSLRFRDIHVTEMFKTFILLRALSQSSGLVLLRADYYLTWLGDSTM